MHLFYRSGFRPYTVDALKVMAIPWDNYCKKRFEKRSSLVGTRVYPLEFRVVVIGLIKSSTGALR